MHTSTGPGDTRLAGHPAEQKPIVLPSLDEIGIRGLTTPREALQSIRWLMSVLVTSTPFGEWLRRPVPSMRQNDYTLLEGVPF